MSLAIPRHPMCRWQRVGVIGSASVLAIGLLVSTAEAVPSARSAKPASVGLGVNQPPSGTNPPVLHAALRCARPANYVRLKRRRAVTAVAVGMAESYCDKDATGQNPPTQGCPNGSRDRGLWQINSCYHREVTDRCAYRARCNARAAKHISDRGRNWTQWSTYNSGAYRAYLDVADKAVRRIWRRRH